MKLRQALSLVMMVWSLPIYLQAQQASKTKPPEQTHFSIEEEELVRPVSVPASDLQVLKKDERTLTCLKEKESQEQILGSWFAASEIHLNGDDLADLVVTAANPCLLGANIGPFWVFRNTPRGYELVLNVYTHDLMMFTELVNRILAFCHVLRHICR